MEATEAVIRSQAKIFANLKDRSRKFEKATKNEFYERTKGISSLLKILKIILDVYRKIHVKL